MERALGRDGGLAQPGGHDGVRVPPHSAGTDVRIPLRGEVHGAGEFKFCEKITHDTIFLIIYFFFKKSHSNLKNGVVNLVGALCFVSVGSLQIRHFNENEALLSSPEYAGDSYRSLALANGAMAIINGAVWLADALYCIVQVIND